ncbi:MAG: GDSL-type esterase/lipase family protein [Cellulophaga sp.]
MKYLLLLLICPFLGFSQDISPFQEEINAIQNKYDSIWDASKETIVFTGSSSIRFWKNLPEIFPNHQIVNSGFGGSQANNLLHFIDETILNYNPTTVFIYEGDNDIFSGKRPKKIIATTKEIIQKIKEKNTTTKIILIAAKPSISRWNLKRKYKRLNRKMKRLCKKDEFLYFGDIWDIMLHQKKPKNDIFISDGLHMNSKGYDLWFHTLKQHIN